MVLLLPVGLLVAVILTLPSQPEELSPVVEPVFTRPVEGTQTTTQDVMIGVSFEDPVVVRVGPGGKLGDVVTARMAQVGDPVKSGDIVAVVGSRPVVALATPEPFHRSLARGDRGPDVAMLQDHLRSGGWLDGEADGSFGPGTGQAVLAWRKDLGDPEADRAFDLGQVLWLPDLIEVVAEIGYQVGGPPPAAGEIALQGQPTPSTAVIQDTSGTPVSSMDEDFVLVVGDVELGPVTGPDIAGDQMQQLEELLATGELDRLELEPEEPEPESDGPATEPANQRLFAAQLRGASPRVEVSVPGSAVVDSDETTCVFAAVGNDGTEPVAVTVVGGSLDTVLLRPDAGLTDLEVLVNPLDVVGDPSCG